MDEQINDGKSGETVIPFPGSAAAEPSHVVVSDQVIAVHQGLPGQSQKLVRAVRAQDVTRACLAASMDAALKLISWINHDDPQVSLKAIAMVMDRGLGKAVQTVNLTDETDPEMKAKRDAVLDRVYRMLDDRARSAAPVIDQPAGALPLVPVGVLDDEEI